MKARPVDRCRGEQSTAWQRRLVTAEGKSRFRDDVSGVSSLSLSGRIAEGCEGAAGGGGGVLSIAVAT